MPSEAAIQDALAQDPSVLEAGLVLVGREYHIPNASGTRGFIDLLCRDRYGNFVIVEVKRSNNSAARALHELFKYAELLARERGLGSDRVRCVLVSTTWDELRVPFSLAVRTFEYDTIGFSISVDAAGRITTCEEVVPLEAEGAIGLTPVHVFMAYSTPELRSEAWLEVSSKLVELGCHDHLGFFLDPSPLAEENLYGLYLVLGTTSPTAALDDMREEVPDDSIEAPDGCVWEYRALCAAMASHRLAADVSAGYPDKLWYLCRESGRWRVNHIARTGIFTNQADLFADEDLLLEAAGHLGASETSFGSTMSPARNASWSKGRENIERVLFGNPHWADAMRAWLDEIARAWPSADVAVAIFNPCDVVGSLVNSLTDESAQSMPELRAQVISEGRVERVLHGTLLWDIQSPCVSFGSAFRSVYGDVFRWGIAHSCNETWVFDIDLCQQSGLAYVCVEFLPNDFQMYRLIFEDEELMRIAGDPSDGDGACGMRPIGDWLKENHVDLEWLIKGLATHTFGVFPGLDSPSSQS